MTKFRMSADYVGRYGFKTDKRHEDTIMMGELRDKMAEDYTAKFEANRKEHKLLPLIAFFTIFYSILMFLFG